MEKSNPVLGLCKECDMYKEYGFSPLCKYCEYDGNCPECGEKMSLGNDLNDAPWICPKGHKFKINGRVWSKCSTS